MRRTESFEEERCLAASHLQQRPFGRLGVQRCNPLPPSVGSDAAAPLEFVVERRALKVAADEWPGDRRWEPGPIEGECFVAGVPDAFEVEQRCNCWQAELLGDGSVGAFVEDEDLAALLDAG